MPIMRVDRHSIKYLSLPILPLSHRDVISDCLRQIEKRGHEQLYTTLISETIKFYLDRNITLKSPVTVLLQSLIVL